MRVNGRTVLVTGGTSGIGAAIAARFAEHHGTVLAAGRHPERMPKELRANPAVIPLELDVADPVSVASAAVRLGRDHPLLDTVVHSAGVMLQDEIDDPHLTGVTTMIDTNLVGLIRVNAALVPLLQAQHDAAIITMSSALAFLPRADFPTYCATKAAVHSYTQTMRLQLRPHAVQVVEVIPPYVRTGLMGEAQSRDPAALPLPQFVDEVFTALQDHPDADEIVVDRARFQRTAESSGAYPNRFRAFNERFGFPRGRA